MTAPTINHTNTISAQRLFGLGLVSCVFLLVCFASIMWGARPIEFGTVINALWHFNPDIADHIAIQKLRLPRTYVGIIVGGSLGVAGTLMQALTRNPLADPGLLGVNAGASLFAVLAIWGLGIHSTNHLAGFAFVGAGITSAFVYTLGNMGAGSTGGATPIRLILAGTAVSAFIYAIVSGIIASHKETLETFMFWVVGSLQVSQMPQVIAIIPWFIGGMVGAVWVSQSLNAMALGDDTAVALGKNIHRTRLWALGVIAILCGGAVAIAGPIAFVGLVVPHIARLWVGTDQRWIMAYAFFLGGIIVLATDIVGRVILPPGEIQVGILVALIGGPLFIWIVRSLKMTQV